MTKEQLAMYNLLVLICTIVASLCIGFEFNSWKLGLGTGCILYVLMPPVVVK